MGMFFNIKYSFLVDIVNHRSSLCHVRSSLLWAVQVGVESVMCWARPRNNVAAFSFPSFKPPVCHHVWPRETWQSIQFLQPGRCQQAPKGELYQFGRWLQRHELCHGGSFLWEFFAGLAVKDTQGQQNSCADCCHDDFWRHQCGWS